MSIVVAVRVSDGLVIAADSASTLTVATPDGKQIGVAKVFNNATKVMQLRDYPIAVATWGAGSIGARTISSLVGEYSNTRARVEPKMLKVETEARDLQKFLKGFHEKTHPKSAGQVAPEFGVLVGGYSGTEFFPEEYLFGVPGDEFAPHRPPRPDGAQNFGAGWHGLTDSLVRFHWGRDDRLLEVMERHGVDQRTADAIQQTMAQEWQDPVPFDGMPLQDAIDYAMFMVSIAVGRHRFVAGPELCGGPIDVAAITRQDGFFWVRRKDVGSIPRKQERRPYDTSQF